MQNNSFSKYKLDTESFDSDTIAIHIKSYVSGWVPPPPPPPSLLLDTEEWYTTHIFKDKEKLYSLEVPFLCLQVPIKARLAIK